MPTKTKKVSVLPKEDAKVVVGASNPTSSGMDFNSMISGNAVDAVSAKKKKLDAPAISLPAERAENLKRFLKHKADMKNSESLMREEEKPILDYCNEIFDSRGLENHFSNSYNVSGGDAGSVKFITVDKFSVGQEPEIINGIKNLLGADADKVIRKVTEVKLKDEIFEDEARQKELVALIGNRFAEFFDVTTSYKAVKGLNEGIFKVAGNQEKLNKIREFVIPQKASLK